MVVREKPRTIRAVAVAAVSASPSAFPVVLAAAFPHEAEAPLSVPQAEPYAPAGELYAAGPPVEVVPSDEEAPFRTEPAGLRAEAVPRDELAGAPKEASLAAALQAAAAHAEEWPAAVVLRWVEDLFLACSVA